MAWLAWSSLEIFDDMEGTSSPYSANDVVPPPPPVESSSSSCLTPHLSLLLEPLHNLKTGVEEVRPAPVAANNVTMAAEPMNNGNADCQPTEEGAAAPPANADNNYDVNDPDDDEEDALFAAIEEEEHKHDEEVGVGQSHDAAAAPKLLQKAIQKGEVKVDDSEAESEEEYMKTKSSPTKKKEEEGGIEGGGGGGREGDEKKEDDDNKAGGGGGEHHVHHRVSTEQNICDTGCCIRGGGRKEGGECLITLLTLVIHENIHSLTRHTFSLSSYIPHILNHKKTDQPIRLPP